MVGVDEESTNSEACPDEADFFREFGVGISPICGGICNVDLRVEIEPPPDLDGGMEIEIRDDEGLLDSYVERTEALPWSKSKHYEFGPHQLHADVRFKVRGEAGRCKYEVVRPFDIEKPSWLPQGVDILNICMLWLVVNLSLLLACGVLILTTACFFQWWLLVLTIITCAATFASLIASILFCGRLDGGTGCGCYVWIPEIISAVGYFFAGLTFLVWVAEVAGFIETGSLGSLPCLVGVFAQFAYYDELHKYANKALLEVGCIPLKVSEYPSQFSECWNKIRQILQSDD